MRAFSARLFPPRAEGVGILAPRPLFISGMITPVAQGDGGINRAIVEARPEGVLTLIDPYLDMQAGDRLTVLIEGESVRDLTVEPPDVGNQLFFYLASVHFQPEWLEDIHFQLLRQGATVPEDSVPLRLRIKLNLPGGVDKEPHLPGHSELLRPQVPQDIIDNGVDAEWAASGVPVTIANYPERAARDTVVLSWGSVRILRLISESEAAGSDPVEVLVDQDAILAAGDSNALQLRYRVFDEVWNLSSDGSRSTEFKVEAGAWRLEPPIIREATNGEIDLIGLGPNDVIVQIRLDGDPFAKDDTIEFTWIGTPKMGAPLVHIESVQISSLPVILELKVANADIRAIAGGTGDASYVLRKANGEPPQSSKRAFARVVGELSELPAPFIQQAVGALLDSRLDYAWVLLGPYPGMASGDVVNVIWLGKRADGSVYLHEQEVLVTENMVGKAIEVLVDAEHIGVLDGGTLELYYRVSNDRAVIYDVRESARSYFQVLQLRQELPAPVVAEADGDVLDPEVVIPNGATLRVDYTDTEAGDVLTYYWQSVYANGTASDWIPITEASKGRPVEFRIASTLIEVSRGTTISALYALKRGGQTRLSGVLELYVGTPIPIAISSVIDSWGQVVDGGFTVDTSVTLIGTARAAMGVELLDGDTVVGQAGASAQGVWRFPMLGLAPRRYDLKAKALYGSGTESSVWSFTVVVDVDPVITEVADSRGDVANGGATVDTAVTLTGNASAGQQVELFDDAVTWGRVDVDGLGNWVLPRADLVIGSYNLMAKAWYGEERESELRTFQVVAEVSPTIVHVTDSRGELNEGQTTVDTLIIVSGNASVDQALEVLDGTAVLDTVRTDGQGNWSLTLTDLAVKAYVITARALYGSGAQSTARRFSVVDYVFPTLESVRDSRGEVADGGSTVDTSVNLAGKASANEQVEIFDGALSRGVASVNSNGDWTLLLSNLTAKTYSVMAKAQYGNGEESALRTFTVYAEIKPSITSVSDSRGEVAEAGTTVDTSVALAGKATSNQQVELFDGTTSLATVSVDASGDWSYPLQGLAVRAYSLKARALYGGGQESDNRSFSVVAQVAPTIVSVRDLIGEVADRGFTFDSRVTVSGKASIGQRVEIFEGAISIGERPVSGAGDWTHTITGLTVRSYSIKAVALYGSDQESLPRTFEVRQGVTPVITRVVDSNGTAIGNGGRTYLRGGTLYGTAQGGLQVQILDNGVAGQTVGVASGGTWQATLAGLSVGQHAFTAKAVYGNQPVSAAWRVLVDDRPPLQIDTSSMVLNGVVYVHAGTGQGPNPRPANTSRQRQATGGTPPLRYSSSNASVASVDGNGTVQSRSNGSATITVSDNAGQSRSYSVTVQNVHRLNLMGSSQYIVDWQRRVFAAQLREIFNQYRPGGGLVQIGFPGGVYWARDQRLIWNPFPRQQALYKDMNGGGEGWAMQVGPLYPGIRLS
ncbi:Ig-like domain-containing protein [Pseudomonas sp.]|uniref:Ig-like domain-containing protein n=1 Tax=Pseudomonas sp. TaxID=306 RepID=UPI003BAFDE90